MTTFVRITEGNYRATSMANKVFPLVKDFTTTAAGNRFVTVNASAVISDTNNIRVKVKNRTSFAVVTEEEYNKQQSTKVAINALVKPESDKEIGERIAERFDVLDLMTQATIAGDVRGMIVTGPPGVGKSFGVEAELEKAGLFDRVAGKRVRYNIVKGASTALGLYANLYKYSNEGDVTVFDDCDGVLQDEVCLNLLKGALDSGKKRRLAWNSSASTYLEKEGIPENFLFKGAVIFITNIKFDHVRSPKIKDHLEALMSRCHYLDLTMDSMREKLIRIRQVADTGNLFTGYNFNKVQEEEVMSFLETNKDNFREMSIRMALKLSDLRKISPDGWEKLARSTCMHRSAK